MQSNDEALLEGLTVSGSFSDLITDMEANPYNAKMFTLKIKAMKEMVCLD